MATMGEDSDEFVWQRGKREKRSYGESSEGNKRVRVSSSDVEGPVGSIERIRLQNFMCHDDLDWWEIF